MTALKIVDDGSQHRDPCSLQGLPYDATMAMALVYGGLLALMGVLISWAAPACNNPIFAEIVPPHLRNMIYSFDRSVCGLIIVPDMIATRQVALCKQKAHTPHFRDRAVAGRACRSAFAEVGGALLDCIASVLWERFASTHELLQPSCTSVVCRD